MLCLFVCRFNSEQSSKHSLRHDTHLTTMRCPFLALYAIGSCPVLKSTALSLPAWISILMLKNQYKLVRLEHIRHPSGLILSETHSPALNHFDCMLFVSNDTQFGQKLKQVVTLHYKVPLKQSQNTSITQNDAKIQTVILCVAFKKQHLNLHGSNT